MAFLDDLKARLKQQKNTEAREGKGLLKLLRNFDAVHLQNQPSDEEGQKTELGQSQSIGPWTESKMTGDKNRGVKVALRFSVFMNCGLLIVIIMLIILLAGLLPLKHDVPYAIEMRPYDNAVIAMRPLTLPAARETLYAESEVTRYVKIRYEVVPDANEMIRRWGKDCSEESMPIGYEQNDLLCSYMPFHTDKDEYQAFLASIKTIKPFIEEGKMRQIKILQDPILVTPAKDKTPAKMEVRFQMIDSVCSQVLPPKEARAATCASLPEVRRRQNYSIVVEYKFTDLPTKVRNRHLNQTGFMVTRTTLSEIAPSGGG